MGIYDRDYMKRRRPPEEERGRGASAEERLAGLLGGVLRRRPWLPKLVLWIIAGLLVLGLVVSSL